MNKIICGDCLEIMKGFPAESVDMCMTSPPYYGLRDYGIEQIFGGDAACEHEWEGQVIHDIREETTHAKSRTTDRYWGDDKTKTFDGNHQKHKSEQCCNKC
ncbi:unnamed protein product, partial [marine sediment metagenome]